MKTSSNCNRYRFYTLLMSLSNLQTAGNMAPSSSSVPTFWTAPVSTTTTASNKSTTPKASSSSNEQYIPAARALFNDLVIDVEKSESIGKIRKPRGFEELLMAADVAEHTRSKYWLIVAEEVDKWIIRKEEAVHNEREKEVEV
jgi:hypothetical protein